MTISGICKDPHRLSMTRRFWERGWSLRWCALDPPSPSATGVAKRLSTGFFVFFLPVYRCNCQNGEKRVDHVRLWVRGEGLTRVATDFGGPGFRPPRY